MNHTQQLFFELIRVALGTQEQLSVTPTDQEWDDIFKQSRKQTIMGVCFSGLESLPAQQRPYSDLVVSWYAYNGKTEKKSRLLDERTDEVMKFFRSNGFQAVILKGQGIAQLYPNPLRRVSGDIDIWLEGGRKRIYDFARNYDKNGELHGVTYHHIHFPFFEDTEVEVHVYPSYMNNPILNHRLHKFFEQYPPSNDSMTPSMAFNRVFILLHCFQHFTGHGVGLRQVMDYFYVLRQGFTEEEKRETVDWLEKLHLLTFAGAMMWLQKEVFGLEEKYLLVAPNEKEGRFMLEEICQTGNMGHFDKRNWGSTRTPFGRFLFNVRRDAHFAFHYPQEVLWQPFTNVCVYMWRLIKGLS